MWEGKRKQREEMRKKAEEKAQKAAQRLQNAKTKKYNLTQELITNQIMHLLTRVPQCISVICAGVTAHHRRDDSVLLVQGRLSPVMPVVYALSLCQ